MGKRVFITGGAGFIGSHLADELIEKGYQVRILDNLSEQVHGPGKIRPGYLHPEAELIVGDIRDPEAVRRALKGVEAVYHLASSVGVGQSMYEIASYTSTNNLGTAVLLEAIIQNPVERLIVASSMSIYGEGSYLSADGKIHNHKERKMEQLRMGLWEVYDHEGEVLIPLATPETKPPSLASVYALSKYDQERMCQMIGRAYNLSAVILRFFNVFGPRQALSNPYTGVLAIFASRLLNDKPPLIFEDGNQQRDFVSVYDVARAGRCALEIAEADGCVFNIGSGRQYTIKEIAGQMIKALGVDHIRPVITGKYRVGDIRHCFADVSAARKILGYEPRISLEEGLIELAQWLGRQIALDRMEEASAELMQRGLTI
ncbi:MAG: SDR family NAD(P)-dependent oxidoreductase [bacterium]